MDPPPEMDNCSLGSQDGLDDKDLFKSVKEVPPQVESPQPDSGLADILGSDEAVTDSNVTPNSDTMENLSLQDEEADKNVVSSDANPKKDSIPIIEDDSEDLFTSSRSNTIVQQKVEEPSEEVNLEDDDDDDIFKSARLEPEPAKLESVNLTNGGRGFSEEPPETDIPLEDDNNDYSAPEFQLSGAPTMGVNVGPTLTSFRDEEIKKEMEGGDEFIEIKITSPHKVGEGMSSYMAYTITTSTNLSYFKKKNPAVNRRFSDFLGLRDKLTEKYLQNGRIIPPAPDKSVIGMTKVKMSKEDEDTTQSDFVEKRRASLERYLNRTAGHPNLRVDPDFREFLELDAELPKSNQTSTLSGKSVLKMISKVGDKMTSYTTKMEETDSWFEEKTVMVENLDSQLRKLHVATEAMVDYRKSLSGHTYSLSKSLAMLGSAEDNTKLAAALAQLAEVEEKVEKVHEQQAKDDFFLLSELVHDYIGIVNSVKDAFNERVKAWQSWQGVQRDLNKRREAKVKAELGGKQDRVNTLRQEIAENERQVDMAQENFEKISRIIKKEFEAFDVKKCQDFKQTILQYLEQMLKSQESLVTHWERFLPEIKQMEP